MKKIFFLGRKLEIFTQTKNYSKSHYSGIVTVNSLLWILPDLFLYLCMYINIHTQTYICIFNLKIGLHIYIFMYIFMYLFTKVVISRSCSFVTF